MNVEPGMNLFVIADLSRVWVQADIYEQDMSYIRQGQTATLVMDALPGESFKGTVNFIGPVIDERTRTIKARLEFNNPNQLLKPGMYATVELKLDLGRSLTVPDDAIIDTGQRKVVFIALGGGRFMPREVRLGNKVDNFYTVLSGLSENELVATGAQFFLDSESRLKAVGGGGMAGHEGMGKVK
jgi:Cu(I)/Ag(I) efflux system membrane fusion protein